MNVKPGDLAIVISSRLSPENIGRIVEVLCQAGEEEIDRTSGGFVWWVKSPVELMVRHRNGFIQFSKERPYADACLKPVSGLPMFDETAEDLKEPA